MLMAIMRGKMSVGMTMMWFDEEIELALFPNVKRPEFCTRDTTVIFFYCFTRTNKKKYRLVKKSEELIGQGRKGFKVKQQRACGPKQSHVIGLGGALRKVAPSIQCFRCNRVEGDC